MHQTTLYVLPLIPVIILLGAGAIALAVERYKATAKQKVLDAIDDATGAVDKATATADQAVEDEGAKLKAIVSVLGP